VLEEYAEAKLFAVWLHGSDGEGELTTADRQSQHQPGTLLLPREFDVQLSAEEYLGGLCDLTGEIGRYSVQRGTARDVEGVKFCLRTVSDIFYAIETMERLPHGVGKKMDALRISIEKMERMLYELSLSEAAGGRNVRSDVTALEESARRDSQTDE
jgi:predicted translin family RNA/ssDNA-binding protein